MDFSAWNQVQAYNLGTGVFGLILVFFSVLAWFRTADVGRYISAAVAALAIYVSFRGVFWFWATLAAPEGVKYLPLALEMRWTIWLAIVPMEIAFAALYVRIWRHHHPVTMALVMMSSASAYGLGGLL
jgi:hypothetical protein